MDAELSLILIKDLSFQLPTIQAFLMVRISRSQGKTEEAEMLGKINLSNVLCVNWVNWLAELVLSGPSHS